MGANPSRGRRARFSLRALIRGWPWYYETCPICPYEVLLRTVPNSAGYYTKNMRNWAINPNAFEPAQDDTDGISLFREDFVTQEHLASKSTHVNGVRVSRVTARDCIALKLTPKPAPDPNEPRGHVVIPEMPFIKKAQRTKAEWRKILDSAQKLAQIASKNEIYTPPGLQDPVKRQQN